MTWARNVLLAVGRRAGAALLDVLANCGCLWSTTPEVIRFRTWHQADPKSVHAMVGITTDHCAWCRPPRRARH